MEKGFYHPTKGYWQALTNDRSASDYEAGTVEVPIRPDHTHKWNGSQWVVDQAKVDEFQAIVDTQDLTPAQFEWLLAYTGLEDVFSGLTTSVKGNDVSQYAALKADRKRLTYKLDLTLAKVAAFAPQIAVAFPGVDVSEATIRAAWKLATQFE